MGRLMKYQMDHAERKLRGIACEAYGNCPQDEEFDMPSAAEFAQMYADGKVKITAAQWKKACAKFAEAENSGRYNNKSVFWFLRHAHFAKEIKAQDDRNKKLRDEWDKRRAIIEEARSEAVDRIVLGGEEIALQAIKDFAEAVKSL